MSTATTTMIEEISDSIHFDRILEKKPELLMALFYTLSSELSKRSIEALEQVKQNHDEVIICKIDASRIRDIHSRYHIQSVPTLVVFRGGQRAEIVTGVQTTGFYEQLLKKRPTGGRDNASALRVTVYSTPTCPYCTMVKDYLKSKNITFTDVDVASDQQAAMELVERTGQQGVPQTEINGSFVIGYNTRELDRLLNL